MLYISCFCAKRYINGVKLKAVARRLHGRCRYVLVCVDSTGRFVKGTVLVVT